jgi:hypothetical protein
MRGSDNTNSIKPNVCLHTNTSKHSNQNQNIK